MGIRQKHSWARRGAREFGARIGFFTCALLLIGCSRGVSESGELVATARPVWLEYPCASDSVDDFGWTLYSLRSTQLRVPREYRRHSVWNPDQLLFRRGNATMSVGFHPMNEWTFRDYLRARPGLRSCDGEIAGYLAVVSSFYENGSYVLAIFWPNRWEIEGVGKWLLAVIRARNVEDASRLRQAVLTIKLPFALQPQ